MEKSVSSLKILNIIICVIFLIAFVIVGTRVTVKANEINSNDNEVLPSNHFELGYDYPKLNEKYIEVQEEKIENIIVKDLNYYIEENYDTILFFANAFSYNMDDIIKDLKSLEKENSEFEITNIGYLKDSKGNLKTYDNFEYGLVEYFYNLNKTKKHLRKTSYKPYTGSSNYVEKLILYYSTIYTNVDATTLLSIGAAESGYYKVTYMLKKNNIYGGMSSKGLVKHNNIELGVLKYVRMMSKNYYGKGLISIQSIGKVYCPVLDNGVKKASPHWINLVSKAKQKYKSYNKEITINNIIKNTEVL